MKKITERKQTKGNGEKQTDVPGSKYQAYEVISGLRNVG